MNLLVTGGAGFIGSNFVRSIIDNPKYGKITVLDSLTYAGNLNNLNSVANSKSTATLCPAGYFCKAGLPA